MNFSPHFKWWLVIAFGGLLACALFFMLGVSAERFFNRRKMPASIGGQTQVSNELRNDLYTSLEESECGDSKKASETMNSLTSANTDFRGGSRFRAHAALEAGDLETAAREARASIDKGEDVAASLVILATVEQIRMRQNPANFGDALVRAEAYLRQAMDAAPADPAPRIELAVLFRQQGRKQEAENLLNEAIQLDSAFSNYDLLYATELLVQLERKTNRELAGWTLPERGFPTLIARAYIAMREGDFSRAADFLKLGRAKTSSRIFRELLSDPAFEPYRKQPALAEFFNPAPSK